MPQVSMQTPMMTQQQANMVGRCYTVIYTYSITNCLHFNSAPIRYIYVLLTIYFILAKANAGNTDSKTTRTTTEANW